MINKLFFKWLQILEPFLILSAADYGMCASANNAMGGCLSAGSMGSTSTIVVGAWFYRNHLYLYSALCIDAKRINQLASRNSLGIRV
jgi:hypothetical protein